LGLIPDEIVAEIRDRVDIVAVIGEHVPLKKVGASHKGLCPFHHEKTPSFHVHGEKRSFYCFGCQKGGDIFGFLMELQGKGFAEVVRELAHKTGVALPERKETPEDRARRDQKSRLYDVNAIAAAYFQDRLRAADTGQRGLAYLASRGIGEDVARSFQLGLAPDGWDGLSRHLEARHVPVDLALTLGLISPRRQSSGHYDKFRDRLMCPVLLPAGEIAGFSGRTLGSDPEAPKYFNSPESPLYKKSRLLFGLHAARAAFHKRGRALLVEGNFDVIALHQAGFAETVAPLGTALTDEQVEILRRLAPSVTLCLDGDRAGRAAALKAIPLLLSADLPARVAWLPDGEDPDSFVRKFGPEGLEELLGRAEPAVEFYLSEIWHRTDRTAERRAAALKEAAPLLASVRDDVKRDIIIGQFAAALNIDPRVVRRAIAQQQPGPQESQAAFVPHPVSPASKPPALELKVLAILADHPDLYPDAETMDIRSLLTDSRLQAMYSAVQAGRLMVEACPRELGNWVAREVFAGSYIGVTEPRRTLAEAANRLRRERLVVELEEIRRQLKDAQQRGDSALASELVMRQLKTRSMADALGQRPEEEPR
jgi:DNA primase